MAITQDLHVFAYGLNYVSWCHTIVEKPSVSQIFEISRSNQNHCIHRSVRHQASSVPSVLGHYWLNQLVCSCHSILQLTWASGWASCRIDDTDKYANFCNNDASEVKFDSFDGRNDGVHNCVGLVEISGIFAKQGGFHGM